MTIEETETFVNVFASLDKDLNLLAVVSAYQHLPMKDAIASFMKDLVRYKENKNAMLLLPTDSISTEKKRYS